MVKFNKYFDFTCYNLIPYELKFSCIVKHTKFYFIQFCYIIVEGYRKPRTLKYFYCLNQPILTI